MVCALFLDYWLDKDSNFSYLLLSSSIFLSRDESYLVSKSLSPIFSFIIYDRLVESSAFSFSILELYAFTVSKSFWS